MALGRLKPCEACGAVPPAGVDDNLLSLCQPCLDGCAPTEDDSAAIAQATGEG